MLLTLLMLANPVHAEAPPAFVLSWTLPDWTPGAPCGIAVDGNGYVYVIDGLNGTVTKFNSTGTPLVSWATGGANLCVDPTGNVYVGDFTSSKIRKFTGNGTPLLNWGQAGSGSGQFNTGSAFGVASTGNDVYTVEGTYTNRAQRFSPNGAYVQQWPIGGYAVEGGIAVGPQRWVYVTANTVVFRFSADGQLLGSWGSPGSGEGEFNAAWGTCVDALGNVYVADYNNNRIQKFTSTGEFLSEWGSYGVGNGQFNNPWGVAADASGNVYVTDSRNARVQKFSYSVSHVVADLGFLPKPDGFHFGNEASSASWEMFEQYFGTANVRFSNGKKRPSAVTYFNSRYKTAGNGGSCAGFSSTMELNYFGISQPNSGAYTMPSVAQLFDDPREWPNPLLLRFDHSLSDPITYYHAAQTSNNILHEASRTAALTFSQAYAELKADLLASVPVVIGIHKNGDGHALAPYKLVEDGTTATVSVYDCNHPGENNHSPIMVDLAARTWTYNLFSGTTWSGGEDSHFFTFMPLDEFAKPGVRNWELEPDRTKETTSQTVTGRTAVDVAGPPTVLVMGMGGGGISLCDGNGNCVGRLAGGARVTDAQPLSWIEDWRGLSLSDGWSVPENAYDYTVGAAPADTDTSAVVVFTSGRVFAAGAPSGHSLAGQIDAATTSLVVGAGGSPLDLAFTTEDSQQGRVATWHIRGGGAAWTLTGSAGSTVVALGSSGGSATYDLALQSVGTAEADQSLSGIWIGPHENHIVHTPDWLQLGSTDLEVQIDTNGDGVPDRLIAATICDLNVDPDVLNARSDGKYVTAIVQLRAPWTNGTFIPASFRLAGLVPVRTPSVGDVNGDGVPDVTLKFDRQAVLGLIGSDSTWTPEVTALATTGADTLHVTGHNTIRVILPHVILPVAEAVVGLDTTCVIAWTIPSSLGADYVDVTVSLDGGATWVPVAANVSGATECAWHTPSIPSSSALVAVEAFAAGMSVGRGVGPAFRVGTQTTGVVNEAYVRGIYLSVPRPSPFAGRAMLEYGLPRTGHVRMQVLDLSGRLVRTLIDGVQSPGVHQVVWTGTSDDGRTVAAGMYLIRLQCAGAVRVQRAILIK